MVQQSTVQIAGKEKLEEISDLLFDAGCLSVTYTNAGDIPIFELAPGDINYWQDTTVVGLFDAAADTVSIIAFLQNQPVFAAGLQHQFEQLEDKVWERVWMDHFHPMRFGERLWVCPSWHDIPDPDACNVVLDPGLAFGTGTHETTTLCLEWLESMDLTGKNVLDFGCGSGILAIAALKLGANHVTGIDIDTKALVASKANAERNGVADLAKWYLAEDAPEFKVDVVIANILAGPLKALKQVICSHVNANGLVALSGILDEQAESVEAEYFELLKLDASVQKGQWMLVSGKAY